MMMILCSIDVPGDPIPKGRPRHGKGDRTYTPKRTEDAQQSVAWALMQGRRIRKPAAGPVHVTLSFRTKTKRRCDIDNLAKLVLDAGNGIVYDDDQQVVRLVVDVERGSANPGTTILMECHKPTIGAT